MTRKFVDLSIYLENDVLSDPPMLAPKIEYRSHQQTAHEVTILLPGATVEDLPEGQFAAVEYIQLNTHNGTHLDAPWHFHSTMNKGERAIAIDEVPLEWCFQPGVKLDFRDKADGYVITAADVEAELQRIGHTLQPLEIVGLVCLSLAVVYVLVGIRYIPNDRVGVVDHGTLRFLGTMEQLHSKLAEQSTSLEDFYLELTSGGSASSAPGIAGQGVTS